MFLLELSCLILIINWFSLVNGYPSDLQNDKCLNYCSNDAVCLMVDNNPKCYCLPEWDGERCHIVRKIDQNKRIHSKQLVEIHPRNTPCTYVPNLCNQRGVCYVENDKMACKCSYPYDGARCTEISVCYEYCFNGGVCKETGTTPNKKPECECKEEHTGERCQILKTTTTPETTTTTTGSTTTDPVCSFLPEGYCNSGQCVVIGTQIACQCPPTHTGELCEIPVPAPPRPTTMNPIMTNPPTMATLPFSPFSPMMTNPPTMATLPFSPFSPIMTNPPTMATIPFSPTNPIMTNPPPGITCANTPCRNGSTCYNNGNSYFCYCTPSYTGTNCENFIG